MDIQEFITSVLTQDEEALRTFFSKDAIIR